MDQQPDIMDIAKRRGFFWPSFEIYQGASGFYDYGPVGALLKLRIESLIRTFYVVEENCLLLESPLLTIEDPWIASGHVKNFTDMTTECGQCGEPYRADHIIEEKTKEATQGLSIGEIGKLLEKHKIKCPKCGGKLDSVYDYNLMFKTFIGPGKRKLSGALRPETAQTTYMPFKRLFELARKQIPFGVIQIGKSFRNEISPRKAIIRLREFSQAEVQFFTEPGTSVHPRSKEVASVAIHVLTKQDQEKGGPGSTLSVHDLVIKKHVSEWIVYYLARSVQLFERMGIDTTKLRLRQHLDDERSFYSSDTWDVEFLSDVWGTIELVGIANRSDYDLTRHQELSGKDMKVDVEGRKFIPHVIEVAYGIDRPLWCILESGLKQDGERVFFRIPPQMAPYQVAVFPLVRKDGLPEKAREIYTQLKNAGLYVVYDEGFIGKVYYRQDEIGTPFAVTVDYDTLKNGDVTVRSRDTQVQTRIPIPELPVFISDLIVGKRLFEKKK